MHLKCWKCVNISKEKYCDLFVTLHTFQTNLLFVTMETAIYDTPGKEYCLYAYTLHSNVVVWITLRKFSCTVVVDLYFNILRKVTT